MEQNMRWQLNQVSVVLLASTPIEPASIAIEVLKAKGIIPPIECDEG